MTLSNVCYISEFMTNLISRHIVSERDVYFMSKIERLYRNEKTFDNAKKKNNQYYIENNDDDDEIFESSKNFESENKIFD